MPHDANVMTKYWHAIPCVNVKNVPIPMVQSLQSYLLRREIDIIIVCKWRFHQVKSFQLIDRGEVVSEAVWSSFESIVLDELCKTPDVESAVISKLHNDIVCYSTCNFCTMPLQDDVLF